MMWTAVKLERLQQLLQCANFAELVPPLVALPEQVAIAIAAAQPTASVDVLRKAYTQYIAEHNDNLANITAVCGPPPWIIRSAGLEDSAGFSNAGGYISRVCVDSKEFASTVAVVAFSGFEPLAIAQQRLHDSNYRPQPIACFVQPLITAGPTPADPHHAPYLSAQSCDNLLKHIFGLHRYFGEDTLDTEWALETSQGLVSVTGLTLAKDDGVQGQLAFGFGFAAAQSPGQRANSVAYCWPTLSAPLWSGQHLVQVDVHKTWLVQVRPAPGYTLERHVHRLTAATRVELKRQQYEVTVTPILPAAVPRQGSFLASATLNDAWSSYLQLPALARDALAAVFVEFGVASEHAGIMFRQVGLPVFRIELARIPPTARVVIDAVGTEVWFGVLDASLTLNMLPADCVDLPNNVQRVFDDSEPTLSPVTMDQTTLRLQQSLVGMPDVAVSAAIEHRSAWPTDSWLQCGVDVRSPSLLGWLLSRESGAAQILSTAWEGDPDARAYVRAEALRRTPQTALPSLCAECPELASQVTTLTDLQLAVQLTQADTWAARLADVGLGMLAKSALTTADARHLLESLLRTLADTELLPIYHDTDRRLIVRALCNAINTGIASADLLQAVRHGQWAPTALANLVHAPQALTAYLDFLAPLTRFRVAAALADAADASALLDAVTLLQRALCTASLFTLNGLCRIDIVDTYDQVLKVVLTEVVTQRDPQGYQRYLDLLTGWINFARVQDIATVDDAALAAFLNWISAARHMPMPENFLLDLDDETAERLGDSFLRWQVLMPIASSMDTMQLPIKNAHQLHNLLHQWMLAHFRVEASDALPQRLRQLLTFADGFGEARSCLLRLSRSVLEISLPIVVHKASFLFTEWDLTVEFAELPDAPEDEIGRLLVFEALARRISEWEPAWRLSLHRVNNLGTWTLFLKIGRNDEGRLQPNDMHQLLVWFRVLFDAAYDFSYVSNSDVMHVYEIFGQAPWPTLFRAYVAYREAIDLSVQRMTVHALPFATSLAALCQHEKVRTAVVQAYQAGFDGAWRVFLATTAELSDPTLAIAVWSSRYVMAGQLGLLLAAVWPQQTLAQLAQAPLSAVAGERIGASLLHRRDIVPDLHRLIVPGAAPASQALRLLALHHAPCKVVNAATALTVAQEVAGTGYAFKRCKEYLLAHHADSLSDDLCETLVAQLDWIPHGIGAEQEACIQRVLMRVSGHPSRFRLAEVDYVATVRHAARI